MKKLFTRVRGVFFHAHVFVSRSPRLTVWLKSTQILAITSGLMFGSFAFTHSLDSMISANPYTTDGGTVAAVTQSVHNLQEKKTIAELSREVQKPEPSSHIQAIIDGWNAKHSGINAAVVFRELNGAMRTAGTNADKQFFAASLYKLNVAHFVYSKIESGAINPNAYVVNGKTYAQCLKDMIVVSDNDCPESIAAVWGWNSIHAFTRSNGFGQTSLQNGIIKATATDTAELLSRLQAGTLVNSSHRDELLGYMKQQIWRNGIPAGSSNSTVADKIGEYSTFVHDAAIVYGPKSTYTLVVLSDGGSYANIAELAREISNFVNG